MKDDAHRAYHRHLLARMADVLGVDLDVELDIARLSRRQIENAITRCSRCPDPTGCELWLDEHAAGADAAPHLCRNRSLLDHLRGGY